jgi:hypothetical protein
MFYLFFAGLAKHYCDNIKSQWTVLDIACCDKIFSSPIHPGFFAVSDNRFSGCEIFIGAGFDLNKNNGTIAVNHNQIEFAGFAEEISGKGFEALSFEKFFTAFFTPSTEQFSVSQQPVSVQQHI